MYNLACAYGLTNAPEDAAAQITALLEADRTKWAPIISKDTDFDRIRDSTECKEAMSVAP
jgi:hypothetical protein